MLVILGMLVMSVILHGFGCNFFFFRYVRDVWDIVAIICVWMPGFFPLRNVGDIEDDGDVSDITMFMAVKNVFFCYLGNAGDIGDITCFWLPEFFSLRNIGYIGDVGDVSDLTCFWQPYFFPPVMVGMFGILGISLVCGCM